MYMFIELTALVVLSLRYLVLFEFPLGFARRKICEKYPVAIKFIIVQCFSAAPSDDGGVICLQGVLLQILCTFSPALYVCSFT